MRNLYIFVIKNKDHFVFFLAVLLSSTLLLKNDDPRMQVIRGKSADMVAFISLPIMWIKSLWFVNYENQYLREKNLQLSLQVESMLNLTVENRRLQDLLDFKRQTNLKIVPTRIVNKGIQTNLISLTVDVGKNEGVNINQPVLTPEGVIGKTIQVGNSASIVQFITDHNYRLSVRILPSGATGILRWRGNNICEIREVQKNVNIEIGDQVVTSGFSDIYPPGLPVGDVAGVYDERGNYQKVVNVTIYSELNFIQNAFVIIEYQDEMD